MNNYLIIDAFNICLIAGFSSLKGVSENYSFEDIFTSTVYSMIHKLRSIFPGYKIYACWDTYGGIQFRKDIDNNYKANRINNKEIDFKSILKMKPYFEDLDIINVEIEATEADDTIYALSKCIKEKYKDANVVIVSRDNDLIQVVQAGFANNQYDPVKKRFLDIPPYSVVDFKALVGDPSDNIAGVKGIGKKTAINYITGLKQLNETQKKEFEKYKDMVDASRHPRLEENLFFIKEHIRI